MSPLSTEYVARVTAPGLARGDVTAWASFLPHAACIDLVITVNELVTNSVRHSPDHGRVRVEVTSLAEDMLFVEVGHDGPPQTVALRTPDAARGPGLQMVACLAADWGVSDDPTRTWFTLDTNTRAAPFGLHAERHGSA
ncbi:MAG: putative anti-sigma regulatory factor, serine/threonine protein kinase [Solirubrobacterales bacterium]|nr:putative anti-sigma regulatory factor, serine/threonine protein kinase [Solirubrobacterales bacterium]